MRVCFATMEFFDCGDHSIYRSLQRLFHRAATGQHTLDVNDPQAVLASDFFALGCAPMDRVEWEELIGRTMASTAFDPQSASELRCALVGDPSSQRDDMIAFVVNPRDVGAWSESALRVLLENKSDSALLLATEGLSGSGRISEARMQGWLVYDGCGGSGEVKRTVEAAERLDRLIVIVDSDRLLPNGRESRTAGDILVECENRGIPVHVLERRETENYVPESIWDMVVSGHRAGKQRKSDKAVLVYRWLLRELDMNYAHLAGKYGKGAVDGVTKRIGKDANKDLARPLMHELLEEWRALSMAERAVDDLKVRFGEPLAKKAVGKLTDEGFDPFWFDSNARTEFEALIQKVEAWL